MTAEEVFEQLLRGAGGSYVDLNLAHDRVRWSVDLYLDGGFIARGEDLDLVEALASVHRVMVEEGYGQPT